MPSGKLVRFIVFLVGAIGCRWLRAAVDVVAELAQLAFCRVAVALSHT